MAEETTLIRDKIIESAAVIAAERGWTRAVLSEAAKESGYEPVMAEAVFPGGVIDAVNHFADYADRGMLRLLEDVDVNALRIRDRIRKALVTRMIFLEPHKDAARQAAGLWAMPPRGVHAAKAVWRTADRIWSWAGDTSTDYNYYTKRGLLSGIISSSMLIWLNDEDPEMRKTSAFVDRRIENVMQIGKTIGKIKRNANQRSAA